MRNDFSLMQGMNAHGTGYTVLTQHEILWVQASYTRSSMIHRFFYNEHWAIWKWHYHLNEHDMIQKDVNEKRPRLSLGNNVHQSFRLLVTSHLHCIRMESTHLCPSGQFSVYYMVKNHIWVYRRPRWSGFSVLLTRLVCTTFDSSTLLIITQGRNSILPIYSRILWKQSSNFTPED